MESAAILEDILSPNPQHPSALYYIIYAYDDPIHAPLGLWDDVIAANKAAWYINQQHNDASQINANYIHDFHAINWLSYGYLQTHDYKHAFALVKTMDSIALAQNTPVSKWYYEHMRTAYINETGDWNADLKSLDMTTVELSAKASKIYTNAMIMLYKNHNPAAIDNAISSLETLCKSIPKEVPEPDSNPDYFTSITKNGITAAKIMLLELHAQIKLRQNHMNDAMTYLQDAVKLEDSVGFGYGPPIPAVPAHEMLGDVFMQDHQYVAAYVEYVKALKRTPNRTHAYDGMNRALNKIKALKEVIPEGICLYYHKLMTNQMRS